MLSGIPATGKSTFARWLQENRGYTWIDLENRGLDRFGLGSIWNEVLNQTKLPSELVDALAQLGKPVVFDWGYPPEWLPLVEHLHAAGLDAWWFDGDREAARATFIARRTVSVQALDIQMAKIAKWQPKLDAFYGSRIVRAIGSDHSFTELSSIAGQLLGGKDAIDD